MANIYLRVPPYVADFYRNKDENHRLKVWEPVCFEDFSYEMRLLRHRIISDKNRKFLSVLCYSQQSWNNILKGKLPQGGKTIFIRDNKQWPTPREIVALEGRTLKLNEELFDYLCIALPKEAMVGSSVIRVDSRCSIDGSTAKLLANVLRDEYYHYFYEWCVQEERVFRKKGLAVQKTDLMERFYAQYEIRMIQGARTQNTLRQMAKRLYERGKAATNRRTTIEGEYFSYT